MSAAARVQWVRCVDCGSARPDDMPGRHGAMPARGVVLTGLRPWPRCRHGLPMWENCKGKPVVPPCCLGGAAMTRAEARVLCLAEAARVVLVYGPSVALADADMPMVFEEARGLAAELRARAAVLGVQADEPVQLEIFAEVSR